MNLYGRLLWLLLRRLFSRKDLDIFATCETRFMVNLMDLDLNFHMNNGRYLSLMDLGRNDLMLRAGIFWELFPKGYYPVVVSESIRFKKSLDLFQSFTIRTNLDFVDEKDFFLRQSFWHKGDLVAEGFIKGRFKQRGRKGSVPNAEVFAAIGLEVPPKNPTDIAQAQLRIESLLAQGK